MLDIECLGGLRLRCGGVDLPLPQSRKARALFAFLLLSERPQHRERLTDLFWDRPDDPRGALRSALSRLRPIANAGGVERLIADRERVWFRHEAVRVDVRPLLAGPIGADDRARLIEPLLPGLDLPDCPAYQAWLTAMRDDLAARAGSPAPHASTVAPAQRIGFATAGDGVRIAWATTGHGAPLLKAANWLNHLELDWNSPVWAPLLRELARDHRLVRYDGRGNGLSDREVEALSFDAFVADLETVADAAELDRFPLIGMSQGVAVAIAYAARHPRRVSRLLLWGGYAAGWRHSGDPALISEREAQITLVRRGWGRDDPSYRQIFSRAFMPDATPAELADFDEFQRQTTSAINAARFLAIFADIDVRDRLGEVRCPTLVMHARGDRRVPIHEGVRVAAGIRGAEFVTLPTDSHLLLGRESAAAQFLSHARRFLAG